MVTKTLAKSVSIAIFLCCAVFSVRAQTASLPVRQKMVFSLDQDWGSGIIHEHDTVALRRMISTLKDFQKKYDTYALLACVQTDPAELDHALLLLSENHIPFILDVYSSDVITMKRDGNEPYDISHGRAVSVEQLQKYRDTYGAEFAGVRVFEVFGENYTILASKILGRPWGDRFKQDWPKDNFYQQQFVEDYLRFAKDNHMFLIFSDFYWLATRSHSSFTTEDVHQDRNEDELRKLLRKYPGVGIVVFANNGGGADTLQRKHTWPGIVAPFMHDGAAGFGLSDQSWMYSPESTAPVNELIDWAKIAYANGASLVQVEPFWYWWTYPKVQRTTWDMSKDPKWTDRGEPTDNLRAWAKAFDVDLSPAP